LYSTTVSTKAEDSCPLSFQQLQQLCQMWFRSPWIDHAITACLRISGGLVAAIMLPKYTELLHDTALVPLHVMTFTGSGPLASSLPLFLKPAILWWRRSATCFSVILPASTAA
jgi:hypothetical protein